MKKLSAEEVGKYFLSKGRKSRISQMLSTLNPGEGLIIEKEKDWVGKQPPYRIINRFAKRSGWKLDADRTPDEKGWVVKRIA
jgi:hypothetical protein